MGLTGGGTVGTVQAWSDIAGSLIGEDSIGTVRSGAAVTASITPAAAVVENDTALTSGTIPSVPALLAPGILSDAAITHAEVLADLAALDAVFSQSLNDAALVLTETADAIDTARTAVENSVTETQTKASTALTTAENNAENTLDGRRATARASAQKVTTTFQEARSTALRDFAVTVSRRNSQFAETQAYANSIISIQTATDDAFEHHFEEFVRHGFDQKVYDREISWATEIQPDLGTPQDLGYDHWFYWLAGENFFRPVYGDEWLTYGDETKILWTTAGVGVLSGVGLVVSAPAILGEGFYVAVGVGATTAATEYLAIQTLVHVASGSVAPPPTFKATVMAGVGGAFGGGLGHVAANVGGRLLGKLFRKADEAIPATVTNQLDELIDVVDNVPNRGLPILNPNFTPKPTTLGRVGETLAGITGNKTKILINGRYRIPDGLNRVTRTLTEVKNVKSLSFTRQLRDFSDFAKSEGLVFELFVPANTARTGLSGPLREAIRNGDIILKIIPGL